MQQSQIAEQLLKDIPEVDRQRHRLYLLRHVKELLTQVSKTNFENTLDPKKKSYQCKLACYKNRQYQTFNVTDIDGLTNCVNKCEQPLKDLDKFLDNINFLSKRKFEGCSKKCTKSTYMMDAQQHRNVCLWDCYNRLHKRYVKYWLNQKSKLLARHIS